MLFCVVVILVRDVETYYRGGGGARGLQAGHGSSSSVVYVVVSLVRDVELYRRGVQEPDACRRCRRGVSVF